MDRISFKVNGKQCSVGSEVDSNTFLNDYIRNYLNLRGTKYMCKEGGCGSCVVTVTQYEQGQKKIFSVNSCLVSITSCQDWEVTTIEGIGDRGKGYNPVQKTLAEYNGSQCGYCSPGFVMSMYSLLESNNYDLTQHEIENSFGSNTCRCTGLRPILDAFKSFAKDAPKPNPHIRDIEDLDTCKKACTQKCEKKELCEQNWFFVDKNDCDSKIKKINLKDGNVWYRVYSIVDIFDVLDSEGYESYMLVNGNTGRGVAPILIFPRVLIDIRPVKQLKEYAIDQNLVIGAGTTLTDLMELFKNVSKKHEDFSYLMKLYEHLDLVAHIPVRNLGTIAGNLMVKHRQPTFSSDIFLLFETVAATLTIVKKNETIQVTPEDFLSLDMTGRVITQVIVPPLSQSHKFVSFKIMPRAQNAFAHINAGFLYHFDIQGEVVQSARIVIGGLSAKFVHAKITERFLYKKKIFTNNILQQALHVLIDELVVEEIPGVMSPEYRKKVALGLFYKGLLVLIPKERLNPRYHSGARDFRKTRPLSKGSEVYDTNPIIWPLTEPSPKVDALVQCAGEAKYVNDLPTQPNEVYCAFVTSDICRGVIVDLDPTPALKIPGVLAFFSAKDIPGKNSFLSQRVPGQIVPQEMFADKTINFYDQAIGLIVAETEKLANQAALLVRVKYDKNKEKPILTINDARKREPNRVTIFLVFPARDRGLNVQRVIKGSDDIYWQYHFTLECQSSVTVPSEDGIDIYSASQYIDSVQCGVADVLNIEQNRINVTVPRCGGGFGSKITRASHVACASALVTYLMNRPCRFVMSIQANMRIMGRRLPCTRDFEVGVDDSGEIQYLEYHLYEDYGYIVAEPIYVLILSGIKNCYDNRRWQYKLFNVVTDTTPNVFARSPGTLETICMTENIMEQISYEINRDPVEVRRNNFDRRYVEVAEILQTLLTDGEYYKRKEETNKFNAENRWKKRGLRVAIMNWPAPVLMGFHVLLSVYQGDGTVIVTHGGIEMGQGVNTRVIQTVAYTLNISTTMVKCKAPTAATNPNNFADGGSRSTQAVCFGAIKCCQIILDRMSAIRETLNDPTWQLLVKTAFVRGISLQSSYHVTGNDQEPYRSAGVALAEVELDIITGEHEILRVDIVEDAGTSTNPELDIGQIEGGFMMGVGYWVEEELKFDMNTGELLTDRTWNYHVPLAKDIPIDFRIQLRRNSFNPLGTLGSRAVSEPPTCLAVCVPFAMREAIMSSREETGYARNDWFSVDGPFTLEKNVLNAGARLDEFLF